MNTNDTLKQNPNLVTRSGRRIHLMHDRSNRRSFGYTVEPDGRNVHIRAAKAECSDRDRFNKKTALIIVRTRLDSGPVGSNVNKVFESTIAMPEPSTAQEWRELDQTVMQLADLRL